MIKFCDKEAYTIYEGEMTRTQMLLFFLNQKKANKDPIIMVYDRNGDYIGFVEYYRLLKYDDEKSIINKTVIKVTNPNEFWNEAEKYFEAFSDDEMGELLAVADVEGNIGSFAEYEEDIGFILRRTNALSNCEKLYFSFKEKFDWCRQVVIIGFDEIAWKCYNLLKKENVSVYVIGGEWKLFGIETSDNMFFPDYETIYVSLVGNVKTKKIPNGKLWDFWMNGIGKTKKKAIIRG